MTLWELVSRTDHSCDIFGDHDASECPHCLVKQWSREKAKFWSDKIEEAYETHPEREGHIVDGIVNSIIAELGVPSEEQK